MTTPVRGGLLQVLGVAFGVAVIVGNTIGAGILGTPGTVAAHLPAPVPFLLAWVAGGVYALLGVISLAELGTMLPRSGGQYVFAREAFGPYVGFVIGWSDWISSAASVAAMAFLVGDYGSQLVSALAGHPVALAVSVVLAFAVLQWNGIHRGDQAQQVTSLLKALAFGVLIVACFSVPGPAAGDVAPKSPGSEPVIGFAAVVLAMQAIVYTYDGWTGILYFSEEVRDAGRRIPRAMFGGVLTVIAIYLLVNAGFVRVLGMDGLARTDFAAGATARALWGVGGDTVIRVLMTVGLLSAINATMLLAPRVMYAMSRDGLFAADATRVNPGGTPTVSLALTTGVVTAFLVSGTFQSVIAVAAFFFVLNYVTSFGAVFALRRKMPHGPRPYRAWGYPITTAISLLASLAFLAGVVVSDRRNSLIALALIAVSYPAYRFVVQRGIRRG